MNNEEIAQRHPRFIIVQEFKLDTRTYKDVDFVGVPVAIPIRAVAWHGAT
jgi:hypothetical protein